VTFCERPKCHKYSRIEFDWYKPCFCFLFRIWIRTARSEPDSEQKKETELTIWYILLDFIYSEQFPRKQKHKQVCTSHIWMCDNLWHLWPKCDQICFAKEIEKNPEEQTRSQFRNRDILLPSQISQMFTHWVRLVQTLFLFLFWIRIRTTFKVRHASLTINSKNSTSFTWVNLNFYCKLQPIADRVAKNLDIILKLFQRTRILLMEFTIITK